MLVDDPEFLAIFGGGLAFGLISWSAIAYDIYKQKKETRRLNGIVQDFVDRTPPLHADIDTIGNGGEFDPGEVRDCSASNGYRKPIFVPPSPRKDADHD